MKLISLLLVLTGSLAFSGDHSGRSRPVAEWKPRYLKAVRLTPNLQEEPFPDGLPFAVKKTYEQVPVANLPPAWEATLQRFEKHLDELIADFPELKTVLANAPLVLTVKGETRISAAADDLEFSASALNDDYTVRHELAHIAMQVYTQKAQRKLSRPGLKPGLFFSEAIADAYAFSKDPGSTSMRTPVPGFFLNKENLSKGKILSHQRNYFLGRANQLEAERFKTIAEGSSDLDKPDPYAAALILNSFLSEAEPKDAAGELRKRFVKYTIENLENAKLYGPDPFTAGSEPHTLNPVRVLNGFRTTLSPQESKAFETLQETYRLNEAGFRSFAPAPPAR